MCKKEKGVDRPSYKYFLDEKAEKISDKLLVRFALVLFSVYLVVFGCAFAFRSNYEYFTIKGLSMQNTLNPNPDLVRDPETGEYDYVQDGVYIKFTTKVDYDDIIVIEKTKNDSIIKRALAFGGDYITIASIEYDDGIDYRFMRVKEGQNEVEIIYEDYIKSYEYWNSITGQTENNVTYEGLLYPRYKELGYQTKTFNIMLDGQQREVVFFQIPQDHVFYMGDNRTGSNDARGTGTAQQDKIIGKVVNLVRNGTFIKKDPFLWFFHQIGDFFTIIWDEIVIFFGVKA